MNRPDVTVTLLTYNHEKYIAECLDGILKQKISFNLEILVGDDSSTDNTQKILREYDAKYPGRFTMILRKDNLGATRNLYDLLNRARGRYIVGLEGDDYWFDEHKLQSQFDFMEEHSEYIGCSQNVRVVDEYGRPWCFSGKYIDGRHWTFYKEIYTFEDYQNFVLPGQGSTYFYRNVFLSPKYDYSIIETASPLIGDMTLMLILSAQGDWYYMKDSVMTCYRYCQDSGDKSWAGRQKVVNTFEEYYLYRCKLEEYSKSVLNRPLDLTKRKEEIIWVSYLTKKYRCWPEDVNAFNAIMKYSGHGLLYRMKLFMRHRKEWKTMPSIVYAIETGEIEDSHISIRNNTWKDFEKAAKGKTIVAFGRGVSLAEFIRKYGKRYSIPVVLDNNIKFKGTLYEWYLTPTEAANGKYAFAVVETPDCISTWEKDKFVILITTTLYQNQVTEQLLSLGFDNFYSLGVMESKLSRYRKISSQK